MLLRQVALLSGTKKVSFPDLAKVSAALQKQVTRDFGPIWGIDATVDPFADPGDVPPGYWPVTVLDKIPVGGAAGYHLDPHGQPMARILWSPAWSLTASHETLEMLADPFGSHTVASVSVKDPGQRVSYLVEICDPCESPDNAYTINTGLAGQEIPVSDFYTPEYFDPVAVSGKRYSFGGNIKRPRQVLNGGYLSWQSADGHIWQLFGPAEFGKFRDGGRGKLQRERSDALAQGVRSEAMVVAGGCQLQRDPATGFLSGTTGASVPLAINGTNGNARFLDVTYGGVSIGGIGTTVTLTVKAGENLLRSVIDAIPGDTVELKDTSCGSVLDSVIFDASNPFLDVLHVVGS